MRVSLVFIVACAQTAKPADEHTGDDTTDQTMMMMGTPLPTGDTPPMLMAQLSSAPTGTFLRNAPITVQIAAPSNAEFPGATSATLTGEVWSVVYPAPAGEGSVSFDATVKAGELTRTVAIPLNVTKTLRVRAVSHFQRPVPGLTVSLNDTTDAATDSFGVATFTDAAAPYKITYKDGNSAYVINGGMSPNAKFMTTAAGASHHGTVVIHTNPGLGVTGADHASVGFYMDGSVNEMGSGQFHDLIAATGSVDWYWDETQTRAIAQVFAWATPGFTNISHYGELSFDINDTTVATHTVNLTAVTKTTRTVNITPGSGFAVAIKHAYLVRGDNPYNFVHSHGESSSGEAFTFPALTNVGGTLSVSVYAQNPNGAYVRATAAHLPLDADSSMTLAAPPSYAEPTQAVTLQTLPTWTGNFPVYEVDIVGGGKHQHLYTSDTKADLSTSVVIPAGAAKMYVCGTDIPSSFDDLLTNWRVPLEEGDLSKTSSRACGPEINLVIQ